MVKTKPNIRHPHIPTRPTGKVHPNLQRIDKRMISRRQLSKEEKEICENQVLRLVEEVNKLKYLQKYATLLHDEGLEYSYKKQKEEYSEQLKNITADIKQNERKIVDLNEQIQNGVETKTIAEEETPVAVLG
mgnify:CR=1 FL=1